MARSSGDRSTYRSFGSGAAGDRRRVGGEVTVVSPCPRAESEGGDSRSETVGGDTWQATV
jgi:hypothetical protein